jgi:predicted nuclease with TOPRIM domain
MKKEETYEEIEALYEKLSQELDSKTSAIWKEAFSKSNMPSLEEIKKKSEEEVGDLQKLVSSLNRKLRMMQIPKFSELSDFGDVMSLEDFINCVKCGGFIDYDGYGYYIKDNQESDIEIYPSDVKHNSIRKDFDTIIWFNR